MLNTGLGLATGRHGWTNLCVLLVVTMLTARETQEAAWLDTRATQLQVGSLEADIPAGWRDLDELVVKPYRAVPSGTRTLLLNRKRPVGEINVFPIGFPISGDDCAAVADRWRGRLPWDQHLHDPRAATFAGSPGCLMSVASGRTRGTVAILTRNGTTVGVRCVSYRARIEVDYACEKIIYGLRPTI